MDIYQGLDPDRFESHVCTFFPGEYDRYFEDRRHLRHILVDDGAKSADSLAAKGINMIGRLRRLRTAVRQSGAHVIHTHHLGPLLHVWLAQTLTLLRLPWVHTEHNVPDLARGYAHPAFKGLKPLRRPDYVTGVAPNVCDYLQNDCSVRPERIRMVPNGVDLKRFHMDEDQHEIRASLKLSEEDEVVGCIGNLREEKNQRLAIEAAARLCEHRPHLKLVICGDGDRRDDLESLAATLGISDRTLFLGYRFDIPRILSALDIFCLPSVYEGMPVSVLEAWAVGKAVLATDVIGIRDLIDHNINGWLVSPDDPRAMAGAMETLLADPVLRQRFADNGTRRVHETYSLDAMVDQYATLYQQAMRE